MTFRTLFASLAVMVALAAPAAAQTPPDDGPAWVFLVGTWSCTLSTGTPITVTYARGTRPYSYTQHVSAQLPNGIAYASDGWLSYDAGNKRWVFLSEGALGDYSVLTTPGWHENELLFTHVLDSQDGARTSTFKKLNDATIDGSETDASGTVTQHCVKK
jgi:hypothetical protein